ncbi:MAG: hypothetical protein IPP46_09650 [Bacteroidetes bacterium]|nr:hypothetical protein [Bacteroidota bacterium]
MNYLDFHSAVPLVWGASKGYQRGNHLRDCDADRRGARTYLAFKVSSLFEGVVSKMLDAQGSTLQYLTFFIVFIAAVLIMILLVKFMEGILKIGNLNVFNKIADAFFDAEVRTGR